MSALAMPMLPQAPQIGQPDLMAQPQVLSDPARTALVDLVKKALKEEKHQRRMEVVEARRQRFYDRGEQFIYYDRGSGYFKPASESGQELPRYMEAYNIYGPHRRSFVSILSQSTPGINFVANDLQQAADITAANRAEKMRARFDREVKVREIQTSVSRFFCTDGRTILWTRIEDGRLRCTAHGVLETKVPIFTTGIEEWDYCVISREYSISKLKSLYPDIADSIESSADLAGETSYQRYARLGVLGGARNESDGDGLKNLVTRHTCWMRPERYESAPLSVREEITTFFPDGVRLTIVSDSLAEAIAESMDDCLAVGYPSPGDGQSRPSLLRDLIPIQDAFNDGMNQVREYFDYGIPAMWINDAAIDPEAVPDQRSEPGAIHIANWAVANPLTNAFFQEAPAVLPEGLMDFLTMLQGALAQFVTGDLPSLYGAGTPDSETYSGQKLLTDQAKGGLTAAWMGLQQLLSRATKQGVDALATLLQGQQVSIQNADGTSDAFQADEIMPGSYGCYPDEDSSFPETMADRRAALQNVFTQIGGMQGGDSVVGQPDNLKLVKQYSGLADLVIPGAEARDKALRAIEQLLQEQPLPPDPQAVQQYQMAMVQAQQPPQPNPDGRPDQPSAMPPVPQPQPSVAIDEDFDYLQESFDKVKEWLSSDSRVEEERKGNQLGILNVRLFGLAYKNAITKQAQAAQVQQSKPISWTGNIEDVDPDVQAALLQKEGLPGDPVKQQENQGAQDARKVLHSVVK